MISRIAQWGGVSQAVSSNWDEKVQRERAIIHAKLRLADDLERAGIIGISDLPVDGNYRKAMIVYRG